MSPRPADPTVRDDLLSAAARILASDGPRGLSTRRLAAEVGTSTMAVYTHFGSMDRLHRELRADGFARLDDDLAAAPRTDDPVADLATIVARYVAFGMADPERYRAMAVDRPPDGDDDAGTATFDRFVAGVGRCVDATRFGPADLPRRTCWAAELWIAAHGLITLALTGLLPPEPVEFLLRDMTLRLVVGFGDDPAVAWRSVPRADLRR